MQTYHNLIQDILRGGYWTGNRTGMDSLTLPYGRTMVFYSEGGFPAITTKKLHFPGIRGEIIGFLRGYDNSESFKALGCNWWDKDANQNTQWLASPHRKGYGDMGRAYGVQWRRWKTDTGHIDQVQRALDLIRNNPENRRIIINAWRPDEFEQMCLPPCHVLYRFQVEQGAGRLHMSMYQRSSDVFLGVPMNIAGGALMLHLFAAATGLRPGVFTHHLDDTHLYQNSIQAAEMQLRNFHYAPPRLIIHKDLRGVDADGLAGIEPDEIELADYRYHDLGVKVDMVTG